MKINDLITLVSEAAIGKDNFESGAVGSNGYGFVFKNFNTDIPWDLSGKVCSAGSYREVSENLNKYDSFEEFIEFSRFDPTYNLTLVGSVKTLVPSLKFGGDDVFFEVWMFVKTPDDKMFPAVLYWGKSGLSIGAWSLKLVVGKSLSTELKEIINFNPFDFSDNERERFLDALEFALRKVPPSNYRGVTTKDWGYSIKGIKNGWFIYKDLMPFDRDLDAENELEMLLERSLPDKNGTLFKISMFAKLYIYALEYEIVSPFFGDAKRILTLYKEFSY